MKKSISVLVILNLLLFWSGVHASELKAEKGLEEKLNEIYSEILCIGCEGRKTIDHSIDCPVAKDLRARVRSLVAKGFDKDEIVWNFNGKNIAFIHQLPAKVIRNLSCPCACGEALEVCLAELAPITLPTVKLSGCPVIDAIEQDIKDLQKRGMDDQGIISEISGERYQNKYASMIDSAIREEKSARPYDFSRIPDVILDESECSCACTETLRTCIEKMPWCTEIETMVITAEIYLLMGLTPEETAVSLYAPCGKMCGKKVTGRYLGINCRVCQRPVRDKAYWAEIDGKMEPHCCESCYQMEKELPAAVLDNVECKICPCRVKLRYCRSTRCHYVEVQKTLIKRWLLEGKTPEEIIGRFEMIKK